MQHSFFKQIDTEEKAYWLGFIFADGSIEKQGKYESYRLSFTQKGSDVDHLYKLRRALESEHKITVKTDSSTRYKEPITQARYRVNSNELVNDLMELGLVQRKTGKERLPEVSSTLKKHLIRGYIDGNGWIRKKGGIGYVATTTQVRDYITSYLSNVLNVYVAIKDESRMYNVSVYNCNINRKNDYIKVMEHLYQDATIYLTRKKELADTHIQNALLRSNSKVINSVNP